MSSGGRTLAQLLQSIALWGERLERFVHGVSKNDFSRDELLQAGASKCIEAIGEASGEILRRYPEFTGQHPDLELAEAYRARNRLSHGYDTIDWQILWETATSYVPRLTARVQHLLANGDAS